MIVIWCFNFPGLFHVGPYFFLTEKREWQVAVEDTHPLLPRLAVDSVFSCQRIRNTAVTYVCIR